MRLETLPLALIVDPAAPVRAEILEGGIQELADSIAQVGLIQPPTVRAVGDKFEVIAGHRRILACRSLNLEFVPCLISEGDDREQVTAQRLHENLLRVDMTPIEEAIVYAEAFEQLQDIDAVAKMARRSRDLIERRLALLAGDPDIRDALHARRISAGVAEELNRVQDEHTRKFLLRFAIDEGATIAKVSSWRRQYSGNPIQVGAEPERPAGVAAAGPDENPANTCWLCGSQEQQYDLRVRMMHLGCENYYKRQVAEMQKNAETTDHRG